MDNKLAQRRGLATGAAIIVLLLGAAIASWAASSAGPVLTTSADVTCPAATGSATPGVAMPVSTSTPGAGVSNRLCVEFDWVSGSPARIGDASISASQGIPIAASTGASKTVCGDSAISCFGIGGTSVLAPNALNRQ